MTDHRDVEIGPLPAVLEKHADGTLRVRTTAPLTQPPRRITDHLDRWAREAPDRVFLAQRTKEGPWRTMTYAQVRKAVRSIAGALLARGLSAERPVAILSGNDIEQALLVLAAMYVGVPAAPVSPAYSLIATDYDKLRTILARLTPGLIFASSGRAFARAILATCDPAIELVTAAGAPEGRSVTEFSTLLAGPDGPAVDAANATVGPDTVAKILFTSGSTGLPKGVINTQRMLCANQEMLAHWLAFGKTEPPVLVDWLPWHHTFGGNHNLGFVLRNGGTLYIDGGKPTPAGIDETIRNLREVSPTVYFNVPKGYEELVPRLRADAQLRETFYKRLNVTFYAGATLPAHVAAELDALATETLGKRVLMITSLGATETAPACLASTPHNARAGVVGVPLPGVTLKLIPNDGKLEARMHGPMVTPGYWRDPEQTAKAFDEEGFYKLGDALRFAIDGDADGGFVFDGRISEDFKLATGTWVSVGPLRARLINALAPFIRDAVIAGHDRDDVNALLFPEMEACRALLGRDAGTLSDADVLAAPTVRTAIAEKLAAFARESTGSSNRVTRVMLMAEPASIDANEMTDKGSLNQRAVLARRAAFVDALYASPPAPSVIAAR
ncbi:feruloyl-CoA synthase [uncultured Alsobacter sp.]|uniref:feruloyl-CoA synthase n=1 Tax=uncultured Alsobacter sp. TaxID=1748258 RepID=UPI0025CF04E5|nr:feruloyl-CoA synthase [uncultured Alsobacter sp.]